VWISYHGTIAWFDDLIGRKQPTPILYYDGLRSVLCARRWAYKIGGWFTSKYQARLWCEYHGFSFKEAMVFRAAKDFTVSRAGKPYWRVRAREEFQVDAYASHRARCPDCSRRDRKCALTKVADAFPAP